MIWVEAESEAGTTMVMMMTLTSAGRQGDEGGPPRPTVARKEPRKAGAT